METLFNSRVGKHPDSVCQEGNKIITNDFSESSLCATQRKSFDNDLNNHGKRLLEICRSADLRILDGRIKGDSLGRATFHGKSGISVIDYSICDHDLLRRGGSRFFVRRGCTRLLPTSTPINHIVFLFLFLQNTSCIRKPQVI